ncbi:MAG: hypothetical protein WC459_01810 [Patescibacteria group bacterium]
MQIDSSSLYRDIFKRAFFITIKNKFLWIFGFFTTFLGLGSIYELVINKSLKNSDLFLSASYKFSVASLSGMLISKNLDKIKFLNLFLFIGAVILLLAVLGVFIWLAIISLGSLIHASKNLDLKKKADFSKSFNAVKSKFWRLLSINLTGKILIFIFLFITGALFSMILLNQSLGKALIYFLVYLILVALSLAISFLTIYASCFAVLKSDSLKKSISGAWKLFKENWIVSAESAVIMFGINIAVKFILFLSLIIFSIPFMLLLIIFYYGAVAAAPTIILAAWIFVSIILMIIIGSFFSAFQIVAWTLLFDRISKGGVLSKLHRIFG